MGIGTVDIIETNKLRKKLERQKAEIEREERFRQWQEGDCSQSAKIMDDSIDDGNEGQFINIVAVPELKKSSNDTFSATEPSTSEVGQMRFTLPTLSRVCDQYGISNRCAAAIASATLQDIGIVTMDDCSKVVDRSKVRRERQKTRALLKNLQTGSGGGLKSIFFYGRKDKTLSQEIVGGRYHKRTISEEHISMIEEPNSLYLGHVTPSSGTGKHIATAIYDFCIKNGLNFNEVLAVGCDGTATNTGRKNGVIANLQNKLGRPLQWLICLLHANELPLRHLFAFLDGATSGPREYSGPIGKLLENCEALPPVQFEAITCIVPELEYSDLSTDQKYMYEICLAISAGQCSLNLSTRNPGKLSHARWLTAANRMLRLYIATESPSAN
ncbi:uncharacterized protein LOC126892123 [Diabrotica virgifera virgifera]|uniref:Uncharacterized protein n=1 Tax=Diabrotica virgifera virgifera TaxID=50390 RepID=A0ABM5L538_DIAVI|nr:uncharacterized protein LOC126892123 [Diabrotica virgifera virgifera]